MSWRFALVAAAVLAALPGALSGGLRLEFGRSLLQQTSQPPFCPQRQQAPRVLDPLACPDGAVEDSGRCYKTCQAPQTAVAGNPEQCLNPCTGTLTSGGGAAVAGSTNCVRCPASNPQYVLAMNRCYARCATGLIGYLNLCCTACPTGYKQHNMTHCRSSTNGAVFAARNTPCTARAGAVATLTSRLVANPSTPLLCDPGDIMVNSLCYNCPIGLTLDILPQANGVQKLRCVPQPCSSSQAACGGYCVDADFLSLANFTSDAQCDSVFGRLAQVWTVGTCDGGSTPGGGGSAPGGSDTTPVPSPPPSTTATGVARYLSQTTWNTLFANINNPACTGANFYTYSAFVAAANSFPDFANSNDDTLNRRELAAFLAQISHETTGGPATNNQYDWGLCWKVELCVQAGNDAACSPYCDQTTYPCQAGKKYYGRGPMQLSWNYNYAQAGTALSLDLLANPDLVSTNAAVAFKTALWFWMTPQAPKPSCHDAITGGWQPSAADSTTGRMPGFGLTTNIINGGLECNQPTDARVTDRINYFKRYAQVLGTTTGDNMECYMQLPFGSAPSGTGTGGSGSSGSTGGSGSSTGCAPTDAACVCTTPAPRTGLYADQTSDCSMYYECGGPGQYYRRSCPAGLKFNNALQACDWAANVQCQPASTSGGSGTSNSTTDGATNSTTPTGTGVARYLTQSLWNTMFRNINNPACTGANFYNYDAFIAATKYYPSFANSSSEDTNRRELAAFLGQISHEVTGGPATNNQYDWGLCWKVELCVQAGNDAACAPYCDPTLHPCAPGKKYYGRGPMQLSWNYNYAQCGPALGLDLLNNPDLVHKDAVVAFRTALWFWMTPQMPKPSCHDVMSGRYVPTAADLAAGRVPGYGLTTNVINGGLECNQPTDFRVWDRINYFKRYTQLLGTTTGDNLECNNQKWFGW